MKSAELLAQTDGIRLFAEANGWRYDKTASPPALTGLWEQVSHGVARDRVTGDSWEAGRITGGGQSAQSIEQRGGWTVTTTVSMKTPRSSIDLGYLAIALPRRLPHMVLDAKNNDRGSFSSLSGRPKADQALSLEGDFDVHFRLYVPSGYERDALYVFTPDLMALLIDETGDLDVEIRDDRLIVYKPGGFDLTSPATWQRFERIRVTVGAKTWTQTDMYVDDRVESPSLQFTGPVENEIGESGKRLRKRAPRFMRLAAGVAVLAVFFAGTIVTVVLTSILR